ncbi:MAG: hypothetical protein FJZ83_04820 [Chloroflexi bacterium]|nr:hypothetical protein [Chloroflexota bacterium]MBM3183343.1 hypothetical protein [Chloroflexota bacterium]MBM4450847.1 hypothetical protein [Chloroflexota bacterium]MBM4454536.1 hypothetical protein [Chloroflexota bacterium]
MKTVWKALLFGFLVWVIPFVVAIAIYPIRTSDRPLFESIMPVIVVACVVLFSVLYFRKLEDNFLREGIILGILWFAICLAIDLLMFMWGPMKMAFVDYMKDIGLTYLMIPMITIGFGFVR